MILNAAINATTKKTPRFNCDNCNFTCSKNSEYIRHTNTNKHKMIYFGCEKKNATIEQYNCDKCMFTSANKSEYNRHIRTKKHLKNTEQIKIDPNYSCICGSLYKYASGYYRHKKNCNYVPETRQSSTVEIREHQTIQSTREIPKQTTETEPNWVEIIQLLVNENKEIRNFMVAQHNTIIEQNKKLNDHNIAVVEQNIAIVEQNKTLTEVVKTLKPANNSYNTTNNNQSYTINMFLNEKCKDALNFSKFIEELKTKIDIMKIYENGYVDGISKLFIDGLSSMEITERPLHCIDERRNTFYVHDNDEWNKDEHLKDTKKAIFHISQENLKQCVAWSNDIPANVDPDEHITQSIKLCKEAWCGDEKNTDKIIKNISKEIPLNKQVMNEL